MAIDTDEKRASVAGMIIPDGTLDGGDRQTIAGFYRGIAAAFLAQGLVSVAISATLPGIALSGSQPGIAMSATQPAITITAEVG